MGFASGGLMCKMEHLCFDFPPERKARPLKLDFFP